MHQSATVYVADPHFVHVNPDVQVFVDADRPVFFVRGTYWLFDDGKWWTAPSLTERWTYVKKPPGPVRQIDNPFQFVHYRSRGPQIETVAEGPALDAAKPVEPDRKDRPPTAADPTLQMH